MNDPKVAGVSQPSHLVTGPILPTLMALAAPNVLALGVLSLVAIAETSYIGLIGTEALAAMALGARPDSLGGRAIWAR